MSIGFNLFAVSAIPLDKSYMETDSLNALLSDNLKSLMEEKGLNASAWAKEAGMSHTGVRDIILKKVKNPTYSTLLRLAAVANVDVRRITVGPDYGQVDQADADLLDLSHQLSSEQRRRLLGFGEGLLAAQDRSHEEE